MKEKTFNKKEYDKKYKEIVKMYQLSFNKNTQAHVIDKLNSVPNKTAYVIKLIEEDLNLQNQEKK